MRATDAIIKLYDSFIETDSESLRKIQADANAWWDRNKQAEGVLGNAVRKNDENWIVKLSIGALFVILKKTIAKWMVSDSKSDEADLDDDTEDAEHEEFLRWKAKNSKTKW